jgi:hypothetical protein
VQPKAPHIPRAPAIPLPAAGARPAVAQMATAASGPPLLTRHDAKERLTYSVALEREGDRERALRVIRKLRALGIKLESRTGLKALKAHFKSTRDQRKAHQAPWRVWELQAIYRAVRAFGPRNLKSLSKLQKPRSKTDKHTLAWTSSSTGNISFFTTGETFGVEDKMSPDEKRLVVRHNVLMTAIHELTHMEIEVAENAMKRFIAMTQYWNDDGARERKGLDAKAEPPVSTYGRTDAGEDLCEAVAYFFEHGALMEARFPLRYRAVRLLLGPRADAWLEAQRRQNEVTSGGVIGDMTAAVAEVESILRPSTAMGQITASITRRGNQLFIPQAQAAALAMEAAIPQAQGAALPAVAAAQADDDLPPLVDA